MPSSDHSTVDQRKPAKSQQQQVGVPPPEPEHLPCPRCDSTNTKFCYYNNYNFSQPRHFCKACRRYWTKGGTLRDIPIGGGSRKNAKRLRTEANSSGGTHMEYRHLGTATPIMYHGGPVPFLGDGKQGGGNNNNMCGSFTSLLNTHGHGLLALGGFGMGIGSGFEDMGFGLGKTIWPFPGVGDGGAVAAAGGAMGNMWQAVEGGEGGGFVSGVGDCFSLPDLAISTPDNAMKLMN